MSGHQNDGYSRFCGMKFGNQIESVQARKFHVGNYEVKRIFLRSGEAGVATLFDLDRIAFLGQDATQGHDDSWVIFDQEDFADVAHVMRKGRTFALHQYKAAEDSRTPKPRG